MSWRKYTKPQYRDIVWDLSQSPYKPLATSRWPERPPPTGLAIRRIRREFRYYSSFTDRELRGVISHGVPDVTNCAKVTMICAPHKGALLHFDEWLEQVQKDRDSGWSAHSFPEWLATWPCRVNPSGVVEQRGKFRRTDDLSWPHPGAVEGVDSVNAASEFPTIEFASVAALGLAAAIMKLSGRVVKVMLVDLKSAYKLTGQQTRTLGYRQFLTPEGPQRNDRVCFGQADGPQIFSRQSGMMVFIIRQECAYAARCYPTRDPYILAWVAAREGADVAAPLAFCSCFIDDFSACSFDDPLWRCDGTPVLDTDGSHRGRAQLTFDIIMSVVTRFGHSSEPNKMKLPCLRLLVLGVIVDTVAETLELDPEKRRRYKAELEAMIQKRAASFSRLRSMAFKLMVVCECSPNCRPWLDSSFAALRHGFD
ncbi:MAG: hypothetical protein VXZ39_04165, partial [Planctomycetota bacterium]|nr:hypothetical protein [Planctomycetota bacterium]